MLHSLTYSIIDHIRKSVPELTEVVWIYDGISIEKKVKPFVTVEQLTEEDEQASAGRDYYSETYHFQVGLRAKNMSERSRLSDKLKETIRQSDIPLLSTETNPPKQAGFFVADIDAVTPMPSDDVANEIDKHRTYIDVAVEVYRTNGNGLNIEQ